MFLNTFQHFKNVPCGLVSFSFTAGSSHSQSSDEQLLGVTLRSVAVDAFLVHAAAEVTVTQTYVNNQSHPIETFYYFPLGVCDDITSFQVQRNTIILKTAVVREVHSKVEYQDAVRNNPKRFLWIGQDNPQDYYQSRIGVLCPNEEVILTVSYVTEVKLVNEKIQFVIPNTVVPRFPANEVNTSVKINVEILIEGENGITSLGSPSHHLQQASFGPSLEKSNWSTGFVEFVGVGDELDRDFEINVVPSDLFSPRFYLEESSNATVLMSAFCPLLATPNENNPEFIIAVSSGLRNENGQVDTSTLEVFQNLLSSLPSESIFNLIGAGSCSSKFLFANSFPCNEANIQHAAAASSLKPTAELQSNKILQKAYEMSNSTNTAKEIILVLTKEFEEDELDKLFSLAKSQVTQRSRLFVLGIGNAKFDLIHIEKLAQVGHGSAHIVPISSSATQKSQILAMLDLCCLSSLTNIKLTWSDWVERPSNNPENLDPDIEILEEIPSSNEIAYIPFIQVPDTSISPIIFSGTQFLAFGIFIRKFFPRCLELEGTSCNTGESLQYNYKIQLHEDRNRHQGSVDTITKLGNAKAVRQLEAKVSHILGYESRKSRHDAGKAKEKLMQIACKEGIPCKYTGFACTNIHTGEIIKENWTRLTRYINKASANQTPAAAYLAWAAQGMIPYGSIARNKLNSVRKLTQTDEAKRPKTPRRPSDALEQQSGSSNANVAVCYDVDDDESVDVEPAPARDFDLVTLD